MSLPITPGREVPFQYASGTGTYFASSKNNKAIFDWGSGQLRPLTGILLNRGVGINSFVNSTNSTFNILYWSFKNKNEYQKAKDTAESILKNRKL
jgi:hypothetical protein